MRNKRNFTLKSDCKSTSWYAVRGFS